MPEQLVLAEGYWCEESQMFVLYPEQFDCGHVSSAHVEAKVITE